MGKYSNKFANENFERNNQQTTFFAFEKVEFDVHEINVTLSIKYTTPAGDVVTDTINKIRIFSIIDVATHCILGYHICLHNEYSSNDVLMCIRNSLKPWKPKALSVPGLKYCKDAGLPSYVMPETAYAIWVEFCYDNARVKLAKNVQNLLKNFIGCYIAKQSVTTPISRTLIERFFKTLEQNEFLQTVSTTDPKKRKNTEKIASNYYISLEHIEELVDVIIAEYNTTPQFKLSNITPLHALKQLLENGMSINTLSESKRGELLFL